MVSRERAAGQTSDDVDMCFLPGDDFDAIMLAAASCDCWLIFSNAQTMCCVCTEHPISAINSRRWHVLLPMVIAYSIELDCDVGT